MGAGSIQLDAQELAGAPRCVTVAGRPIGVFRVGEQVYAVDNRCPHAHAALHEGHLDGEVIECAFHNARFHLPSGRCLRGPGEDIRTYPVRRDGNRVTVIVEARQTANVSSA